MSSSALERLARHFRDRSKGYAGAAIIIGFGIFALAEASGYPRGSIQRMGPGFFPVALSGLLIIFGFGLVIETCVSRPDPLERPAFRSCLAVLAAIVVFGMALERFGLAPAVMLSVLVSSLADHRVTVRQGVTSSVVLSLLAAGIFVEALGLSIPIVRW